MLTFGKYPLRKKYYISIKISIGLRIFFICGKIVNCDTSVSIGKCSCFMCACFCACVIKTYYKYK